MEAAIAPWTLALGQALLLVALGPLVTGGIQKIKARFQCRRGASVLQPYRDLLKLMRKGEVRSDTASPFFRAVPPLVLAAVFAATILIPVLLVPLEPGAASALPLGDALLLLGWLALARFLTAISALDAGGAFGGMGASREMTVSTLVEPALVLVIVSIAIIAGSTDLGAIAGHRAAKAGSFGASDFLALFAMLILLLAETGRIPVDNPDTHLELTMLHEGMLLEHSGPGLGLLVLATHTKQIALMALVESLFLPRIASIASPEGIALGFAIFLVSTAALAVFLALVESAYAKLRFFNLPQFLSLSLLCAFLAVALRLL